MSCLELGGSLEPGLRLLKFRVQGFAALSRIAATLETRAGIFQSAPCAFGYAAASLALTVDAAKARSRRLCRQTP